MRILVRHWAGLLADCLQLCFGVTGSQFLL
jgi:hypothetical protein